ncbi:MAG TPA: hypothetical protein VI603_07720 [Saprospiraceae bacterium]|nr:hypothetical protein [Saprospiraceae bacterium]
MKTNSFSRSHLPLLAGFIFCLCILTQPVVGQRMPGDVGIGVHIGQPTGLTLKAYSPGTSLDILAAWDLDDFFFLNLHAIYDAQLNDENTVHFFYGPGGYIGIRDRGSELDDDIELGVSGAFGLDFLIQKFEIFLQATPRLSLVQTTNFDMGGGVGFRIYL